MKKYLFFALFLISCSSFSQSTVSGLLLDQNKEPIEFATVIIKPKSSEDQNYGTSLEDGTFSIALNKESTTKEYLISVRFIGFETWTKQIHIKESINIGTIILKEDSLEEIVLKSTQATIVKKQDKLIFNVQETPLKSGYNGMEVLQNTPTIWLDENDNISIRNETATVLINGRKIMMSGEDITSYLENLDSDAIKSIEIQTAKDAIRDATATGGIINIILKEKPLGIQSQLTLNYVYKRAPYFSLSPNWNVSYGSEKWHLYGSYRYRLRRDSRATSNEVHFDDSNRVNITDRILEDDSNRNLFKLGFVSEVKEHHTLGLELFGRIFTKEYSDYGNAFYYGNTILNDQGLNNTVGNTDANSINAVLNHTWKIAPKSKLQTIIDFSSNTSKDSSVVATTYDASTFDNSLNTYRSDSNTEIYAIQTDYSQTLKKEARLDVGFKYSQSDRDNNLLPRSLEEEDFVINTAQLAHFKYKESVFASYLSFQKTFQEKQYFKLGLRVEVSDIKKRDYIEHSTIQQHYTSFFPSLYYSRELSNQKTITASYARSLRRPSFRDLSNNISKINDFQYVLGNPDLQPEFIDKLETSLQVKKNTISLYYTKTNEAINGVYFLEDAIAYYKKFNAGAQHEYGIDYSTSTKINNWWYLNFSTNLFYRKFVDDNKESSFEKTTLGLKCFQNFTLNKTASINLSAKYWSPKSDAFYEASEYYSVDLGYKKSLWQNKLSLRLDIRDLFNTLEYRNKRVFSNYATTENTKRISRFLSLRIVYKFSNNAKLLDKKNKSINASYKRL